MSGRYPPLFSDCVGWPKEKIDALHLLIDESETITIGKFRDLVGRDQMRDLTRHLGYGKHGLKIDDDHHVRCALHRSGAVMLVHSAIEHVFAEPDLIDTLQARADASSDHAMTDAETLFLVHPGSMCGSARMQLGRSDADAARYAVLDRVLNHDGPLFVIDGALSDELPSHDDDLINRAVRKAVDAGYPAGRVWGCDSGEMPGAKWSGSLTGGGTLVFDGQEAAATQLAPLIPAGCTLVTGAWAGSNANEGCVNSVANAIRSVLGREGRVGIDETAIMMPPEFEDPSP